MAFDNKNVSLARLSANYRLIAELLLYPEERDEHLIAEGLKGLKTAPKPLRKLIKSFIRQPASHSAEEYVATLELSPPCPLYMGSYLFDEPKSCRGAGMSGRNSYMMELANIYRHFGFELNGGELSDFLPVMVEFLAISLERQDMDQIGLRRSFIERYLLVGLDPLGEALSKYESPYGLLVEALGELLAEDAAQAGDAPAWTPPVGEPECAATCRIRLEAAFPAAGEPAVEVEP
ncbi:MAG: molecular chaperone TorD family protein [Proteobacteria bacterium]|nr:molecular chaperone TorD family protein [Pseudomonadota bacterium]